MRVLFISDVYFPRVNGVSTSIATFRTDLAAAGVTSTLIAPEYLQPSATGRAVATVDITASAHLPNVIRVASRPVPFDPEDRRMQWGALRRALAATKDQEFDLVHVQTPFLAHYAGVRYARAACIPVVETYHTFFEEYLHHYVPLLPRPLGRRIARTITRSQCNQVDAIVAPSLPMREMLEASGVTRPVHVIPTGLPSERFARGQGLRFRQHHQLPADRPLLLYVGRVAHEKNIDFLIRSFLEVRRTRPDAMLVIAGEGPARATLAAQVEHLGLSRDVAFVGYLDRERSLADCYAAAAVFVFASRTETQGLVLLEAMAQGCAVVSTAYLGTASILQPGCGAHVAPEEPLAFAQAVIDLLDDPSSAVRLGEQAARFAEGWASNRMALRMRELYADLCNRAAVPIEVSEIGLI